MFKKILATTAIAFGLLLGAGAAFAADYSVKQFLREYDSAPAETQTVFEDHLEVIVLGANASPMFQCFPMMEDNGAELLLALQALPAPQVWELKTAVLKAARDLCNEWGTAHEALRDEVTVMADFSQWTPMERQETISMMAYGADGAGIRSRCDSDALDRLMKTVSPDAPMHSALFVALSNQSCRVM